MEIASSVAPLFRVGLASFNVSRIFTEREVCICDGEFATTTSFHVTLSFDVMTFSSPLHDNASGIEIYNTLRFLVERLRGCQPLCRNIYKSTIYTRDTLACKQKARYESIELYLRSHLPAWAPRGDTESRKKQFQIHDKLLSTLHAVGSRTARP